MSLCNVEVKITHEKAFHFEISFLSSFKIIMSDQSGEKLPSASLKLVLSDSSFNQKVLDQNSYTPTNNPATPSNSKNCPRCQFPNEKLSKFCSECGYKYFFNNLFH